MYRLAAACTPQSSQGPAWHPRVDYEFLLYNDKFFHKKWGGSGRPSRPASDGPRSAPCGITQLLKASYEHCAERDQSWEVFWWPKHSLQQLPGSKQTIKTLKLQLSGRDIFPTCWRIFHTIHSTQTCVLGELWNQGAGNCNCYIQVMDRVLMAPSCPHCYCHQQFQSTAKIWRKTPVPVTNGVDIINQGGLNYRRFSSL